MDGEVVIRGWQINFDYVYNLGDSDLLNGYIQTIMRFFPAHYLADHKVMVG